MRAVNVSIPDLANGTSILERRRSLRRPIGADPWRGIEANQAEVLNSRRVQTHLGAAFEILATNRSPGRLLGSSLTSRLRGQSLVREPPAGRCGFELRFWFRHWTVRASSYPNQMAKSRDIRKEGTGAGRCRSLNRIALTLDGPWMPLAPGHYFKQRRCLVQTDRRGSATVVLPPG